MCGIAGLWGETALEPDAQQRLSAMTRALAHRGPDGCGQWLGPGVGLAHTRLAIIDLSGGAQPMWGSDGNYVVTFNGEIYNHHALREELTAKGYVFRSRSDTEVLWAAIDAWGVSDGLAKLRGMFAFALYNVREHRLLLARDRSGIKPMYWAQAPNGIVFGSEIKTLAASGILPRRMNVAGIHDYLGVGYATAPQTCWADVQVLEPGGWMMFDRNGSKSGRYWNWEPTSSAPASLDTHVDRLRDVLRGAVRSHLISDVPVGAFLSGGLDSSLITAFFSECAGDTPRTFCARFGDTAFDEGPQAKEVSEHFHTEHRELLLGNGQGDPETFQTIVEHYDEPFGDSSCIPSYLICKTMREHLKVVLSGDGGDEVLGGYTRYAYAQQLGSLARWKAALPALSPLVALASKVSPRRGEQARKAWQLSQADPASRLLGLQTLLSESERAAMYHPDFLPYVEAGGQTIERFRRFVPERASDPVEQFIAAEVRLRLHADYLRKVDMASSAHGLEVRVPFLDNEMLDFGSSLPTDFKVKDGETKILSRRLAAQHLPAGLHSRPKTGFSIPLDRWAGPEMKEYFKSLLDSTDTRIRNLIRPEATRTILHQFLNPEAPSHVSHYQRYQRLFLLVSLELWLRRWSPSLN